MNTFFTGVLLLAETETNKFDPNSVTPGVEGFLMTGLMVIAVLLLIFDMVRRQRRIAVRHQVNELLDAEEKEASADTESKG